MRLPEEGPGDAGAGPGSQACANVQWRGRLRQGPRRGKPQEGVLPEKATAQNPQSTTEDETSSRALRAEGHHTEATQSGPENPTPEQNINPIDVDENKFWSEEEMKEVIWCFVYKKITSTSNYKEVYEFWRARNPNCRVYIDAKKLLNQKNSIIKRNKVTRMEIEEMETRVRGMMRRDSPVGELEEPVNFSDTVREPIPEEMHRRAAETPEHVQEDVDRAVSETAELERLVEEIRTVFLVESRIPINQRKRLPKIPGYANLNINMANRAMQQILYEGTQDLNDLNCLIYSTARVLSDAYVNPPRNSHTTPKIHRKIPPWKHRIRKQIEEARKTLSRLVNITWERPTPGEADLLRVENISTPQELKTVIEALKQRVAALACRMRRIERSKTQYYQNKMYRVNRKKLFREILRESSSTGKDVPSVSDLEQFWGGIYGDSSRHEDNSPWIKRHDIADSVSLPMNWQPITAREVATSLKMSQDWKSPGPDNIPNYWLKRLHSVHESLAKCYNNLIDNPTEIPNWLMSGKTILIPKNSDTADPKNYRPIACLNTIYKNLTSIIAQRLQNYLEINKILPYEQKGCRKNCRGCKDLVLLSNAVIDDCKVRKKNLSICWVDYRKAFDSVPHSWIKTSLQLIGTNHQLVRFLESAMKNWETRMTIFGEEGEITTSQIKIKRGIYQGDSLSPLLFCIALIPLSREIQQSGLGYQMAGSNQRVHHVLFMDDLKLFGRDRNEMDRILTIVERFSSDIKMQFGLDKCARIEFRRGSLHHSNNFTHEEGKIRLLDPGENYSYLGVDERAGTDHEGMKIKVEKEYIRRVRAVLQTELHARNKIESLNSLALPVMQYSFGLLNWRMEEIRRIDRRTRKMLCKFKQHHPRADIDRLYAGRRDGGRGLMQVEAAFKLAIISLADYVTRTTEDPYLKIVRNWDKNRPTGKSLIKQGERFSTELNVTGTEDRKRKAKESIKKKFVHDWEGKPMHGQFLRDQQGDGIDRNNSWSWIDKGTLKGETEGLLVAAQDQALRTRYIEKKIYKATQDSKCRMCKQSDETVDHVMAACPVLAAGEYIIRHDRVCTLLHFKICEHLHIPLSTNKWYRHKPNTVSTNQDGSTTILWNQQITTDRKVAHNKPDIVVRTPNMCLIIDVAVPSDSNIIRKEAEKIIKYRSLEIEIKRMWSVETAILPVVIGATGRISSSLRDYLDKVPGNHSIGDLQKTAVLGTASILRKTLTC